MAYKLGPTGKKEKKKRAHFKGLALLKQARLTILHLSYIHFRGKGKKGGKKVSVPFRKDFGELSTLRSFCSGTY